MRHTDFVIPLNWGCTIVDPAKTLYERMPGLVADPVTAVSLGCGFPLADIAEMGPAIVTYARDQAAADGAADALLAMVNQREPDFAGGIWEPDEAVAEALARVADARGPVVLADTQDNPGGGGTGDTTGMLRALVKGKATGAVLGVICDPEAAAAAHAAGVGAELSLALGGKSGAPGQESYDASYKVLALGDGRFTATGPMWLGSRVQLGPMALLEISGVRVLIASRAMQAADQAMFRHLGIEPVEHEGTMVTPLHFLKTLLPDPAELGRRYSGKTCIGCMVHVVKDGVRQKYYMKKSLIPSPPICYFPDNYLV